MVIAAAAGSPTMPAMYARVTRRSTSRMLFGGFSGSEVKLDGKELLILSESEILAVIGK